MSPSSRRAWIEMLEQNRMMWALLSPSSRRAWIEMSMRRLRQNPEKVALLAEGVDRNCFSNTNEY